MESARISMDLSDFESKLSETHIEGCLAGQKNVIEIFRSFKLGKSESIELPEKLNPSIKKMLVEFIDEIKEHFDSLEDA